LPASLFSQMIEGELSGHLQEVSLLSKLTLWIGALPAGLIGLGSLLLGLVLHLLPITILGRSIGFVSFDTPHGGYLYFYAPPYLIVLGVVMLGSLALSRSPVSREAQLGTIIQLSLGFLSLCLVFSEMETIPPPDTLSCMGGCLSSCLLIAGLSAWVGWKLKKEPLKMSQVSLLIALGFGTLCLTGALLLIRWRLQTLLGFGPITLLASSFISFMSGIVYVASYPKLENLSRFEGAAMGMLSTTLAGALSALLLFTTTVGQFTYSIDKATGYRYDMTAFDLFLLIVWWLSLLAMLCAPFGALGGALAVMIAKLEPTAQA